MAVEITCVKTTAGHLAPYGDDAIDEVKHIRTGQLVRVTVVRMRNPLFHRKAFALARLAFDLWVETLDDSKLELAGEKILPSFRRFREDITIMAGYYTPEYTIEGHLRLRADSWSFGSMDEETFERLYSQLINVILSKVLAGKQWSEERLRAEVERVLAFDG